MSYPRIASVAKNLTQILTVIKDDSYRFDHATYKAGTYNKNLQNANEAAGKSYIIYKFINQ